MEDCPNLKSYLDNYEVPLGERLSWLIIFALVGPCAEEVFFIKDKYASKDIDVIKKNLNENITIKYRANENDAEATIKYEMLFVAFVNHLKEHRKNKYTIEEIIRSIRAAIYYIEKLKFHIIIVYQLYNAQIIKFFMDNYLLERFNQHYAITDIGKAIIDMLDSNEQKIDGHKLKE